MLDFAQECYVHKVPPNYSKEDFGKRCYTMNSEQFFYDSAYQHVKRDIPIAVIMRMASVL